MKVKVTDSSAKIWRLNHVMTLVDLQMHTKSGASH